MTRAITPIFRQASLLVVGENDTGRDALSRRLASEGFDVARRWCAIVHLAHNLGMNVVAEGVETVEQLAQLRTIGCELAQGFHFSRAVDVAAADVLIATQPWWEALELH